MRTGFQRAGQHVNTTHHLLLSLSPRYADIIVKVHPLNLSHWPADNSRALDCFIVKLAEKCPGSLQGKLFLWLEAKQILEMFFS